MRLVRHVEHAAPVIASEKYKQSKTCQVYGKRNTKAFTLDLVVVASGKDQAERTNNKLKQRQKEDQYKAE